MRKIFILLITVAAGFALSARSEELVVFIDTSRFDTRGGGNQVIDQGYYISNLQDLYPSKRVVLVDANSNIEAIQQLRGLIGPNDRVAALLIHAHGMPAKDYRGPYIANQDGRFVVYLNSEKWVRGTFGPLVGRFTPTADVVFTSCVLLKGLSDSEKMQAMKTTARYLGLSTGSIYMNETTGGFLTRINYGQPFYSQRTWLNKGISLGAVVGAPVIYPVLKATERYVWNQGFRLVLAEHGQALCKDNLLRASGANERQLECRTRIGHSLTTDEFETWKQSVATAETPANP